jgi:hypothetical protein
MSTRQQAIATAQVYLKRFYTKNEIRQTNPYLVLTTAFYLACKMEECPQHIRFVVGEARGLWPGMRPCLDELSVICRGKPEANDIQNSSPQMLQSWGNASSLSSQK